MTMKLIKMQVPSVNRIQFTNKESMDVWGTKIEKARIFYPRIEMETVKHGLRKCMILHRVRPENFDMHARTLAKDGLILVPISKEGDGGDTFAHQSRQYEKNRPFVYRVAVARKGQDAEELVHASQINDDRKIGELLGFPECCSNFFYKKWRDSYSDPIWQQAEGTINTKYSFRQDEKFNVNNKHIIRVKESNSKISSVFRYIGVRVLSHLPCALDCKQSLAVANDWIDLATREKIEGLEETLEIMKLPFEWDCFKGIVVINTPVFKFVSNSMNCFPHYVVQVESEFYPKEASKGLVFPWENPLFRKVTTLPGGAI